MSRKQLTKSERLNRSIELGLIVDGEDLDLLYSFTWNLVNGYVYTPNGKKIHRMVAERMFGEIPSNLVVDHKDGNKLNNSRENLRLVTRKQNCQNTIGHKDRTSRFRNVCWDKGNQKFRAQIMHDGKQIKLGLFSDELEAAEIALIGRQVYFTHSLR